MPSSTLVIIFLAIHTSRYKPDGVMSEYVRLGFFSSTIRTCRK